jgi:hypothetical protein
VRCRHAIADVSVVSSFLGRPLSRSTKIGFDWARKLSWVRPPLPRSGVVAFIAGELRLLLERSNGSFSLQMARTSCTFHADYIIVYRALA